VNAEVYMKITEPTPRNPPGDSAIDRLRAEIASHQRWFRIDRQLDRLDHRIDRLERTLEYFDQTNKRMEQLLNKLEATPPRKQA
jgi:hypothetical protein